MYSAVTYESPFGNVSMSTVPVGDRILIPSRMPTRTLSDPPSLVQISKIALYQWSWGSVAAVCTVDSQLRPDTMCIKLKVPDVPGPVGSRNELVQEMTEAAACSSGSHRWIMALLSAPAQFAMIGRHCSVALIILCNSNAGVLYNRVVTIQEVSSQWRQK